MLKELTLKNFRKHREQAVNFQGGLTVIRGKSEAGKTTLAEAILYAMFGSSVLRETLAETVTYGEPEASLKVSLTFTFDGVDYKIVRGKSGAELHYADQTVTGQRETKVFIERLLGCSSDTARLLMFADQNAIRGVLAKGGTAANGLVETLAQLGLIEDLVDAVQRDLPSGNTKALDAQIANMKDNLIEKPAPVEEPDFELLEEDIAVLQTQVSELEELMPDSVMVKRANAKITAAKLREAEISALFDRQDEIRQLLSEKPVKPEDLTDEEVTILTNDPKELSRMRRAYETVFPISEATWEGTEDSLVATIEDLKHSLEDSADTISEYRSEMAVAKSKIIYETKCPTCSQELPNHEAIECVNTELHQLIERRAEELAELEVTTKKLKSDLAAHQEVLQVHKKVISMVSEWHSVGSQIPARPVWIGAAPPDMSRLSEIKAKEAKIKEWERNSKSRKALEEELAKPIPESLDVTFETEMLENLETQKEKYEKLAKQLTSSTANLERLKQQHTYEVKEFTLKLEQFNRAEQQLVQLEATRQEVLKHNELIKKLRAARPEIASKMWGSVLGAVSKYFTQIRGEDSVVIRDSDGFKVNGRSVEGLSGSTQDMLGLAIRMALSKLFLPNLSFLMLDESFSACDDNRELNGVSTLAAAGFTQVILITHSDAPETIADNLITL